MTVLGMTLNHQIFPFLTLSNGVKVGHFDPKFPKSYIPTSGSMMLLLGAY